MKWCFILNVSLYLASTLLSCDASTSRRKSSLVGRRLTTTRKKNAKKAQDDITVRAGVKVGLTTNHSNTVTMHIYGTDSLEDIWLRLERDHATELNLNDQVPYDPLKVEVVYSGSVSAIWTLTNALVKEMAQQRPSLYFVMSKYDKMILYVKYYTDTFRLKHEAKCADIPVGGTTARRWMENCVEALRPAGDSTEYDFEVMCVDREERYNYLIEDEPCTERELDLSVRLLRSRYVSLDVHARPKVYYNQVTLNVRCYLRDETPLETTCTVSLPQRRAASLSNVHRQCLAAIRNQLEQRNVNPDDIRFRPNQIEFRKSGEDDMQSREYDERAVDFLHKKCNEEQLTATLECTRAVPVRVSGFSYDRSVEIPIFPDTTLTDFHQSYVRLSSSAREVRRDVDLISDNSSKLASMSVRLAPSKYHFQRDDELLYPKIAKYQNCFLRVHLLR